jgi:hypothetical protein
MYRVIWNPDYEYAGYRNNPADTRPQEIDADRYELNHGDGSMFMTVINFFKGDRPVAALFQLPVAIVSVADIQE